jgi:hypothetical protein
MKQPFWNKALKAVHDSFLFKDDFVPEWGRNNPERVVYRYGAEQ